ncbi:CMGC family protein kinase [Trichomonas vaginalis G3]|uniref:CMGC family protein kinase n=1 Tax=Trichomonas vaginalis (strain ATCC PRA-98 / G3) TaxID=412133 RepID=A2G0F6_TRIV3|nr:protein serine/threonine kinase protein [Trichomonas vaginalis G3]EAX89353.1 CMGC family protein kinase [Trichomonas vaginalis G3]KAI5501608.1 protein serine/threonine kinase protein [Trichomonas vaginalis G3]|eukprot:XP_001302283.1 CMGC family protein kinase [Trichomonas vaginalis G3]
MKNPYQTLEEVKQLPEITTLIELRDCPFIVKLHEVLFDFKQKSLALVFEKLDMNLYEYTCMVGSGLPTKEASLIIYQILQGLSAMHAKYLFHRDMKPENCMINRETLEVKIVDLGSTRKSFERGPYTEYVSTRWYRAPEILLTSGQYGPSVDVWAVGCMLYELLENRPLFPGKHELDQINRIHALCGTPTKDILKVFLQNPNTQLNYNFPYRRRQHIADFMSPTSFLVTDLIEDLLIYNPLDRITVDGALAHPVFAELNELYAKWHEYGCPGSYASFVVNGPPPAPKTQPAPIRPPIEIEPPPQEPPAEAESLTPIKLEKKKMVSEARKAAVERIKAYNKLHASQPPAQSMASRGIGVVLGKKSLPKPKPGPYKYPAFRKPAALPPMLTFSAAF